MHDVPDGPELGLVMLAKDGPPGSEYNLGTVQPEGTIERRLSAGEGTILVLDLDAPDPGGRSVGTFDVTLPAGEPGQTLRFNASSLPGLQQTGEPAPAPGALVVRHDVEGLSTVTVGVVPEGAPDEQTLGTVAPGQTSAAFPLPPGTHRLNLYDEDGTQRNVGDTVTVVAGETLGVDLSAYVTADAPDAGEGVLRFVHDRDDEPPVALVVWPFGDEDEQFTVSPRGVGVTPGVSPARARPWRPRCRPEPTCSGSWTPRATPQT